MCVVRGFASALRRFIAEKLHQNQAFRELAALTDRQLDDIGLQRDELVLAVAGVADAPERVGMMASKLGIEGECFEARRPLLNQMVKRCAACRTKVLCAWWLAEGGAKDAYREFCPNAGAFVELSRRGI
jgi:uncharacterized protein YjiS (DUF1127 family)